MARKGERDIVKFNWNQSGMPVSLVSRMGRRSAVAEFKSVLNIGETPLWRCSFIAHFDVFFHIPHFKVVRVL